MARLYPNKPVGTISPEVAKVLHALRRIPGDDLHVWLKLPIAPEKWRPDLMAVHSGRSAHLFAVSPLTEAEVETALHGDLFASPGGTISAKEIAAKERDQLRQFRQEVLDGVDARQVAASLALRCVVAFPLMPQELLDQVAQRMRAAEKAGCAEYELWGREALRAETLASVLAAPENGPGELPPALLRTLRERFNPEVTIPPSFVAREEKPDRDWSARLGSYLLDLDQEWLAKEDLALPVEAAGVVGERRLKLVTGVAGSGKSLVLLYRAMLCTMLHPSARIVILTHNRPLTGELRDRFNRLCRGNRHPALTFYQWCQKVSGRGWKIIEGWKRVELVQRLIAGSEALKRLTIPFLLDELDWIRDQGFYREAQYLAAARAGRVRPLNEEQRRTVFALLRTYQDALNRQGLNDWPGVALSVWRSVEQGRVQPPSYDLILVDEAQFFAPVWLRLVNRCLAPGHGGLFLAADPTQGFLKRRQSWAYSGLEMRGHSVRLRHAYRNTQAILHFAARFYRSRLPEDDEEINLPEPEVLAAMAPGESPQLLHVDSQQAERGRVANEIAAAIRKGRRPAHFLVILPDGSSVNEFITTLDAVMKSKVGRNLKDLGDPRSADECVGVCSIHAVPGVERPVVFICGLDTIFEKEDTLGVAPEDRLEQRRDNTRLVYSALTRAGARLVVTYRRPAVRRILEGAGAV